MTAWPTTCPICGSPLHHDLATGDAGCVQGHRWTSASLVHAVEEQQTLARRGTPGAPTDSLTAGAGRGNLTAAAMRPGDLVQVTFDGRTVRARVALVTADGRPGAITFDAMLGGYVGMMPIVWNMDGTAVDLIEGREVVVHAGETE
jgi:hypothetical protein